MNDGANTVAVKTEKHVELDNAIESMDSVIHQACDILRRIQNADSDKEGTCDTKTSSLKEILDFGADRIREKNADLRKILDEISDNLF